MIAFDIAAGYLILRLQGTRFHTKATMNLGISGYTLQQKMENHALYGDRF